MPDSSITKITRPRLSGTLARTRLFRLMDQGRQKSSVTWLSAPAGSGKTTLVAGWLDARKLPCVWYQVDSGDADIASFFYYLGQASKKAAPRHKKPLPLLTPEYLQDVPVFTRRFFEELFRRQKPPFVMVFDNYQEVPLSSVFHAMMSHAFETVPNDMHVVILSRNEPPQQLARLLANNDIHLITDDDVRFTLDESRSLLKTRLGKGLSSENLNAIHAKTEGWVAGLVLLMAQGSSERKGGSEPDHLSSRIFDYFANEIFDKTDPLSQQVLLITAFFPRTTAQMAKELTGVKDAGQILERLSRQNYFTQKYDGKETAYQYHPLFREFLLVRARSHFDTAEQLSLKRKAAALLLTSGKADAAAPLLIDSADWPTLACLILREAENLVKQGRSKTLEDWIRAVPEDTRAGNAWLIYWLGMCRMPFDPRESRFFLEKSFEQFRHDDDTAGCFISWAALILTFGYEWGNFYPVDRWIATIEDFLLVHPDFPSPETEAQVAASMFIALYWRKPLHPNLPKWADKVMKIVLQSHNNQLRMTLAINLLFYYLWCDDSAKATSIINTLKPLSRVSDNDPLTQVTWFLMEAMYAWLMSDVTTCESAVKEGLAVAHRTGVHLMDERLLSMGCESSMGDGSYDRAAAYLADFALLNITRLLDRGHFQHLCSSIAWARKDWQNTLRYGENALKLVEESGNHLLQSVMEAAMATALFDMGRRGKAETYLDRALKSGEGIKRVEFCCKIQKSRFAFESGEEDEGLRFLHEAMSLGARYGYVNFIRWNSDVMSRLCAKALERNIEPDYVRSLIQKRELTPPADVEPLLEHWPYRIVIQSLGRFTVTIDGKPLSFAGKVQKKPLELLKALIALGGTDVAEERINQALWPDAEGDTAHRSFETTLYRLRKLIGDKVLRLQDGLLTLDRRYCRVDAWDFERRMQGTLAVDRPMGNGRVTQSSDRQSDFVGRCESTLALYKGHFLPSDADQPWSLSLREWLKSAYIGLVLALGQHLEEAGEWQRAVTIYRKGVETDELAEEFYRHLMRCHIESGQHVQAFSVYRQCRAVLSHRLGLSPSSATEELHGLLHANSRAIKILPQS